MLAARVEPKNGPEESRKTGNFKPLVLSQFQAAVDTMGDTRGVDCVFATKEQCAQDGRGRGFGTQCIRNPSYNPALGSVVERGQAQAPTQVRRKSRKYRDDR
jgi:hypothetical protein